ncbi:MAG: oligosaccharide flippase family protein [Bacteroidales bacterium]
MLRKFLKDSTIYGISGFLTKGVALLLIPFYTRVLAPAEYGIMDFIAVVAYFAGVFLSLEIYQAIARFYLDFENQEKRVKSVSTGLLYTTASFTFFVVIVFIFSKYFSVLLFNAESYSLILKVASVNMLFATLYAYTQNVLRYNLKALEYVICSLINSFLSIGFSVFLVLFLKLGVVGIFCGQLIGNLISLFFTLYYGRANYGFVFDKLSLKFLLVFSIPLVPSSLGVYVLSFVDRFLIKHYINLSDLGIYGLGYRIASISSVIMLALNTASTPLIYANYKNENTPAQLSRLFQLVVFGALTITLAISVFAKEILIIFTTPEYYGATVVIPFLVAAGFLSKLYDYTPGLYITKKTKTIAIIYISGAVFNVGLNLFLIPITGILGAAVSSIAAALFVFLINLYYSQKLYYIPFKTRVIIISCISTTAFIIISYFINFDNIYLNIGLKIIIVLFAILILFKIRLVDFKNIYSFISPLILRKFN